MHARFRSAQALVCIPCDRREIVSYLLHRPYRTVLASFSFKAIVYHRPPIYDPLQFLGDCELFVYRHRYLCGCSLISCFNGYHFAGERLEKEFKLGVFKVDSV